MHLWPLRYWSLQLIGLGGMALAVFALPHLMPGQPVTLYENWPANTQQRARLISDYGFDRSLPTQCAIWLQRLVTGQWGASRYSNRPVFRDIWQATSLTLLLLLWTLLACGLEIAALWGLHYLAPWAILSAQAVVWAWQRVAASRPKWRPDFAIVGGFACLALLLAGGFIYKGAYLNRSREDTAFLLEARRTVPLSQPLMINSADEALEGLRMQFYIGDSTIFLHNLSFVRDDRVQTPDVYVVTRYNRVPQLQKYGQVEPMLKSKHSRRETSENDRWTLFRMHLRDGFERKNAQVRISPMQAMYREPGPDLD